MKILLTGATGFLGRALAARLAAEGHALVVLTRRPDRAPSTLPVPGPAFAWRSGQPVPPESLAGVEAVIHLAGERIAGRWTAEKMRAIRESRVLGTRSLVDRLETIAPRPRLLISASGTGYYGDRGDETLTEDAGSGSGFLAGVCREWEAEATRAEALGVRVVRLRSGVVLGAGGGVLGPLLPLYRAGLGGPLGSGRQWWPWVSLADHVGFMAHALTSEVSGAVNIVAPEPIRQRDFAREWGRVLRRPAFLPTPGWALRLALGRFAPELLASQRVVPRAMQRSGYAFVHPDLGDALRAARFTRTTR